MRAITFAIICCGLFSLIAYSQTTFFKRTEANVNKAALGRTIPLEHALFLLSKAHQIHFIYEDKLIEGKTASHNVNITDSLYKDLQNVFDKHPIGYEKVGFRTFVLTSKSSPNSPSSIKEGIIQGKVTNRQGEAIPGADVFIPNTPWGSTADREGQFTIKNIPPANYTLTAQVIGYQSMTKEIYVTATESTTENFTLHLDVLNMDEVVTIASRNPLTKLESSVAVTSLTNEQIAERGHRSTADLLKVIPGFYVESSGGKSGNNLFPRGIPQDGSYRYIAMYEDGMPLFEAPELAFANIDVLMRVDAATRSLESIRGGTGSIYASNAPGGIINFINKTGGEQSEGLLRFTVGDYQLFRTDYNYGGSINDQWQFNVGGFVRYDHGIRSPQFIANKGGQVKANLTRLFKNGYIRLHGKYLNDKNIFYLPIPLQNPDDPEGIPGFDANYGTMTSIHANEIELPTPDGETINRKLSNGIHPELTSLSAEIGYELGHGWEIRNITRWLTAEIEFNAIFSLENPFSAEDFATSIKKLDTLPNFSHWEYRYADTGEPIANIRSLNDNGLVARNGWWTVSKPLKSFANQFQIQKRVNQHTFSFNLYLSNYSAGDFWYWHNILTEVKNAPRLLDLVALNEKGEVIRSATKDGFEQIGTFYVKADNEAWLTALYIVDEWQLNNDLRLDGGFRYERSVFQGSVENTRSDFTVGDGSSLAEDSVSYGDDSFRNYEHAFNDWAISLGANYSVSSNLAFYGRLSKGFRMPDFEQWIFSEKKGNSQHVQQVESGIKLSTSSFALFGTAFFSRLNDIPFVDEVVKNGRVIKESRFAESTTIGTELEANWQPLNGLGINMIWTLQDPKLREFVPTTYNPETGNVMTLNLDGKQVRRIPRILIDLRPSYSFKRFKIFGEWRYIGKRYVDDANTSKLPAYNVFNAGASYELFKKSVTLAANVANITNTVGLTEGNPRVEQIFANRTDKVFMARPVLGRSITLAATYTF